MERPDLLERSLILGKDWGKKKSMEDEMIWTTSLTWHEFDQNHKRQVKDREAGMQSMVLQQLDIT